MTFPFLSSGFHTKPSVVVCVLLFASLYKRLFCSLYFQNHTPSMLLHTLTLNSLVLPLLQPDWKPLPLSSHFLPEDLPVFPPLVHCFLFPFHFSWNFSVCVYFPFHDAQDWDAICIDISIHTRRVTFFFENIYLVLVSNLWENKTKQRKTLLSQSWNLFNEFLHRITVE